MNGKEITIRELDAKVKEQEYQGNEKKENTIRFNKEWQDC